jgi:multicomponent Na+:H+ antiporter subunit E
MPRTLQLTLILTCSWWILAEGDPSSWALGVPTVALAVWTTRQYARGHASLTVRYQAIPAFALYFVLRSLVAGVDVARRTLAPSLPIAPRLQSVHTTLPDGLPRVLLVAVLSLMPGSLGVSLNGDEIELHVLDARTDVLADVRRTEARIARLFQASPTTHATV